MKYSKILWKWRIEEGFAYKLYCNYEIPKDFICPYYSLTADGWLIVYERYAWDGATRFPDFDWIKTPSAIHDALHDAIARGVIPETMNDLIDIELELAIINGTKTDEGEKRSNLFSKAKVKFIKFRGWYIRKATNTAFEKRHDITILELPQLRNEITLADWRLLKKLDPIPPTEIPAGM